MIIGNLIIIYMLIDEVFYLVIYLFLFIVKKFIVVVGIDVVESDILVVVCILVEFLEYFIDE